MSRPTRSVVTTATVDLNRGSCRFIEGQERPD